MKGLCENIALRRSSNLFISVPTLRDMLNTMHEKLIWNFVGFYLILIIFNGCPLNLVKTE